MKKIVLFILAILILAGLAGGVWFFLLQEGPLPFSPEGRLPSCGDRTELFTAPSVALEDLGNIAPLGNLNPPGHTFPTRHLYFGLRSSLKSANLYAPGDITITSIRSQENLTQKTADYSISFSPCREFSAYFFHVTSLAPALQSAFESGSENRCEEYETGGSRYRNCDREVRLEVKAGERLGTVGSVSDFGAADSRTPELNFANPKRWGDDQLHTVCALDYYPADLKESLKSKLGDWGGNRRTIEPICGTVMQDAGGTAGGVWFVKGTKETYPEDPHLAFVHSNFDPRVPIFSVGTSIQKSGLPTGVYEFVPYGTGVVNLNPDDVFPNGKIYCYNLQDFRQSAGGGFEEGLSKIRYSVILQLLDKETMQMENLGQTPCGTGPWSFSSQAVEFER